MIFHKLMILFKAFNAKLKTYMNTVLFLKLTSMGDLIHALPALTEARQHHPDLQVDWVADKAFADIPSWHPAVRQIIKSAHRHWRKNIKQTIKQKELSNFIKNLRQQKYDILIDGQVNIKTAVIGKLAKTKARHGFCKKTASESIASLALNHHHTIKKQQHAILRLKQLFAASLNYTSDLNNIDFGIDTNKFKKPILNSNLNFNQEKPYLFIIPNASWTNKLWPESYWQSLIQIANNNGYQCLLPSGNPEETARAEQLANKNSNAIALPRMSLSEIAYLINQAKGTIGLDTGLSHLAGALNVPTISLFGPTDSNLVGNLGQMHLNLQGPAPCAPCYKRECFFKHAPDEQQPHCMAQLKPEKIWLDMQNMVKE